MILLAFGNVYDVSIMFLLHAGFLLKKSAKTNGWSRRWFVLNEKTGKVSNMAGTLIYFTAVSKISFKHLCRLKFMFWMEILVQMDYVVYANGLINPCLRFYGSRFSGEYFEIGFGKFG